MTCQERKNRALLADYALELLPSSENQQVEQHLAGCEPCRLAVREQRGLAHAVRETVHAATAPSSSRLHALMPAAPARRTRPMLMWQPIAALALLAILFLGSLQMNGAGASYMLPTASNTALAATATQTPSASVTETPLVHARLSGVPLAGLPTILPPAAAPRPARLP